MAFHVYIAGPYSYVTTQTGLRPDVEGNTKRAIKWARKLLKLGYLPFVPHLFHYLDFRQDDWEFWVTTAGYAWIEKCDAVLRIPGYSEGADREELYAESREIPVFYTIGHLKEYARKIGCEPLTYVLSKSRDKYIVARSHERKTHYCFNRKKYIQQYGRLPLPKFIEWQGNNYVEGREIAKKRNKEREV